MPPRRKAASQPQLRNVAVILNRESPAQSAQPAQPISLEKIHLPAKQPRRFFDADKMAQLVASVKEFGILEPLLVRPLKSGEYELVAGERRLRAARELGLTEVPILVHDLDERQALQVTLIENLQREDLNPIEETEAVLDLLAIALEVDRDEVVSILHQSYNAKQRGQELNQNVLIQIGKIESLLSEIGRFNAGTFRSSRLPLLNLPDNVLSALRNGEIEYTKGQAIARVKNEAQRAELLKQAISENLPLSEIKARIQEFKSQPELAPEKVIAQRWSEIGKRLQKGKIWSDRKKRDRITKLLNELDKLTASDD
ncbi:ParB/RepB/Spo0J family partition protein [Trichocoleus desertorum]|uniref:ParB/RepB/Spo0J family partition protein n=1 Tax=Trichocoleus desertorum GB2-A4 TaxID=2933944 RepID=A0ABV0JF21_9CYAN|nr:ParB/RepB/Spo0J family partition protein [Trichocoleus sp. FACHB-46]